MQNRFLASLRQSFQSTEVRAKESEKALSLAVKLILEKYRKEKARKRLCVCLEFIGDNGKCPVHG